MRSRPGTATESSRLFATGDDGGSTADLGWQPGPEAAVGGPVWSAYRRHVFGVELLVAVPALDQAQSRRGPDWP
jgi:hypothetical protein